MVAKEQSEDIGATRLLFEDTQHAVELNGCEHLVALFRTIMPGWSFLRLEDHEAEISSFLTVRSQGSRYLVDSVYADKSRLIADPVDVVCAIVADLAWATVDANARWLCLHCAAFEIKGGLVLFPNIHRSGKSTLATVLGLKNVPIFTDDFLAIEVNQQRIVCGLSSGVAPRMRQPWPPDLSSEMMRNLSSSLIASSRAYSYHSSSAFVGMPVKRGKRLPIRAFVLLNRDVDLQSTKIAPIDKADVLTSIIKQNFARSRNASKILRGLHFLASNLPGYEMQYQNAEKGADQIIDFFQNSDRFKAPLMPEAIFNNDPDPALERSEIHSTWDQDTLLSQVSGVDSYCSDEATFLADTTGFAIHKLDPIGSIIWKLMAEPISGREIVELLCISFPDTGHSQIESDVMRLLSKLLAAGLIRDDLSRNGTARN